MYVLYIHSHTSDCVETVYELPRLPNNTAVRHFYTRRERWEVLTGYLSLGCRPGGGWAKTWHWTKRFKISSSERKWQRPQVTSTFFIAFL